MNESEVDLSSLGADYFALRDDVGLVELAREAVRVSGEDALKFLQGQLSQDVDIDVGSSTWTLLLTPQGKVIAFARVLRPNVDEFILDFDGGWAQTVIDRLMRFKLRVNADVAQVEGWRCLAVRGPRAHELAPEGVPVVWPGLAGADIVGVSVTAPAEVRECSRDAYEALRIEAGVPVMGAELDDNTIPEEAGVVARSVSFTKGCYTGQELVARVDSRGANVPRRLRAVVVAPGSTPPRGAALMVDAVEVGRLTSVTYSPGAGSMVGLAYVRRKVEPPSEVVLQWDQATARADITALPIVDQHAPTD